MCIEVRVEPVKLHGGLLEALWLWAGQREALMVTDVHRWWRWRRILDLDRRLIMFDQMRWIIVVCLNVRTMMLDRRHIAEMRVRHFMVMYSMMIVDWREFLFWKLSFHRVQLLLDDLDPTVVLTYVQYAVFVDFASRRTPPLQIRIRIHNGALLRLRMLVVGGRIFDSGMQFGYQIFIARIHTCRFVRRQWVVLFV